MIKYKFNLKDVNDVIAHFESLNVSYQTLSIQDNIYLIVEANDPLPLDQLEHLEGVIL